jgi:hypothetical protein
MGVFFALESLFLKIILKKFRVSNREIKRLNSIEEGKVLTHIAET